MYNSNIKMVLYLIISFVLFNSNLAAQSDSLFTNITLKTFLENENVPLNKEVVFHVELSWKGELDRYKIEEIVEPAISGLYLRGSGSSNKLIADEVGSPQAVRRVSYYFSPQSIGMAYIDGLTIQYEDNLTGKVETLIAQRIGIKIIDPVISDQDAFASGTFFQWILLIIFLLLTAYFGFRFIQRRSTGKIEEEIVKSQEEKYLDLMKETIHLSNNAAKENISSLSKLLNSYIAEKFSIHGNVNLEQLKAKLSDLKIDEDRISKIGTMCEKADLARFAAEEINTTELHLFYDSIESILKEINDKEKSNAGD